MKLKHKGEGYQCAEVSAQTGEVVEVSQAKADQLLTDFPKEWEIVAEAREAAPEVPEGPVTVSKNNRKGKIPDRK